MFLRNTHRREIGQILAALTTLDDGTSPANAEPVRGWHIELLADSLERAIVTESEADEQEQRPPVRAALGDLTLALRAHEREIRALAEVADALPDADQDAIRALAARARLAFAAATRERRRKQLLRAMRSLPESGGRMNQDTDAGQSPFAVSPRRLVCAGKDGIFRHMLVEQLRTQGFDVAEVADTPLLLDRVARTFLRGRWHEPLDLVIVDARRGGLAALDAIAKVRQVDGAMPAVVLVPEGTEIAEEAARLGAAALVYPPHTIAAVAAAIREALA